MIRLPNLGGYTASDLENMGFSHFLHLALTAGRSVPAEPNRSPDGPSASQHGVPPSGGPLRELRASVVKGRRRPRSKASQFPPDIQLSLNAMLAAGRPYTDIIRSLNDHGHPGFNKVNLHNWKATGYQLWLRTKTQETTA